MSCTYVIGYVPEKGKKGKCQHCKTEFSVGDLRVGTESTTADGKKSTRWKHWRCAGARMLTNIGDADRLEGLGDLKKKDQEEVRGDFAEHGEKKTGGGGGRSGGKAKAAPAAKKAAPARKKAKKQEEEEEEELEESGEEEEPAAGGGEDEEGVSTGAEEEEGEEGEEEEEEEEEASEEEEEEEEEPAPAPKGKRGRK